MRLLRLIPFLIFAGQLLGAYVEKSSLKPLINEFAEESYNHTETQLLENLDMQMIKVAKDFEICSPKQIASFFLAYYVVNMSAIWENLKDSVGDNEEDTRVLLLKHAYDAVTIASEKFSWIGSKSYSSNEPWNIILGNFMRAGWDGCKNTLKKVTQASCDSSFINNEEIKLRNMHQILSLVGEESFVNSNFKKIYGIILVHLHRDNNFNVPTADILKFIGQSTWEQETLKNNQYIKSLKKVMTAIVE